MRTQIMVPDITLDPIFFKQKTNNTIVDHHHQHENIVIEEIQGLIKVYKDGHVERPQIVPCVSAAVADPELGVTSMDIVIDRFTNVTSRFYIPKCHGTNPMKKLPLFVYFHGGGFCVGSAAWSCYHEFLAKLAAEAGCIIMSVNYRLAPEHPLPAAYEDGLRSLVWLKQEALCERGGEEENHQWWSMQCDFSRIFLVGDSAGAGANIAHNVSTRVFFSGTILSPLTTKGVILLQPFFGGEARTSSEKYYYKVQPRHSVLNLAASDSYWRLALPAGSNRDHPWCNPLAKGLCLGSESVATMVCISELDILKDREFEFCGAMARAGKKVETVVYRGVGHAFQVLDKSMLAQTRCHEMINDIKAFVYMY
ncbi:LOW QUALITY PROTEIN: probable carboxylesterase 17 [Argentina anserina]|uniref:LOW QUALITY PROTEIN: probable carboxylesterase 17 n=1 Tax=Argentina anserina TaxID=57926 RepID=UPI002176559A|nr:LOW QUALITY PROTEIN: probable carboxylesterase 17 [Potentilla anserina]